MPLRQSRLVCHLLPKQQTPKAALTFAVMEIQNGLFLTQCLMLFSARHPGGYYRLIQKFVSRRKIKYRLDNLNKQECFYINTSCSPQTPKGLKLTELQSKAFLAFSLVLIEIL